MQGLFHQSEFDQPHPSRARAIIKAHPEVRQLMVRNPYTALIALSLVIMQTTIAYWMGTLGFGYWWLSLLIAYCVGAFANHCNYVIIHDATHNLIFRRRSWNKMVGILADLPNLTPGAMGFRVYHLKHHSHQGDYEYDADLANHWEARLVGNKWYRKAIWLMLFPVFDLPSIPWSNLPKLRAVAPEFYDNLKYHTSWTRLLFQFIFDERYSLFSRVERMKQKVDSQRVPDMTASQIGTLDLSARPIRF